MEEVFVGERRTELGILFFSLFIFFSFPLWFIVGYITQFPVLYNRAMLFICSICNSLYVIQTEISVLYVRPANPRHPVYPFLSPLDHYKLFSMSVNLFLFHR